MSLLTIPGVVTHEIAHRFFCDLAKIPVYDVCYFRVGDPAGYVIHGPVKELKSSFLISIGPLIANTILCSLITFSATFPIYILKVENCNPVFWILLWIGFSIGMHAFPSNDDMENFVHEVRKAKQAGILLVFAKIFAVLLKLANILKFIWFDALYAFGVCMFLPWLVM